jgi:hypothetical protein
MFSKKTIRNQLLFYSPPQLKKLFLTCRAAGLSEMISAALASDLAAWCSPSAAITLALASLAASASAAMAR